MSQKMTVLNHLKTGKTLTALEAIGVYRIFRLAARVAELRKDGYEITTINKRDETGKTYASYKMAA